MKIFRRLCFFAVLGTALSSCGQDFEAEQNAYPRVRQAAAQYETFCIDKLNALGLQKSSVQLYLRGFKHEKELEVWARDAQHPKYQHLHTYSICKASGKAGPKRQSGDKQVPEGFYRIDRFNPKSRFLLSLGLNYPNASDKQLGVSGRLGGDIFIHGDCVSVGCLALGDEAISSLYLWAMWAQAAGNTIPVTLFPARPESSFYKNLLLPFHAHRPAWLALWKELEAAYTFFNAHKVLPSIQFLEQGRHRVQTRL